MPPFPPVTMYTLPLRSGRESGWKAMVYVFICVGEWLYGKLVVGPDAAICLPWP
jgi:hypothetical protein